MTNNQQVLVRFAFIEANRCMGKLKVLCHALGASVSGFLSWRNHAPGPRRQRDTALASQVAASQAAGRETYGSPRLQADPRETGESISRKRVYRQHYRMRVEAQAAIFDFIEVFYNRTPALIPGIRQS